MVLAEENKYVYNLLSFTNHCELIRFSHRHDGMSVISDYFLALLILTASVSRNY